jgi:hypothetical protein
VNPSRDNDSPRRRCHPQGICPCIGRPRRGRQLPWDQPWLETGKTMVGTDRFQGLPVAERCVKPLSDASTATRER